MEFCFWDTAVFSSITYDFIYICVYFKLAFVHCFLCVSGLVSFFNALH